MTFGDTDLDALPHRQPVAVSIRAAVTHARVAWTTISTLTSPSGNGANGPIPMGRQSIRLAVISGSGEVLVASVPRTVFGFATVPLSTLFPGPTGVGYRAGYRPTLPVQSAGRRQCLRVG